MKSTLERLKEYNDLNDITVAHNNGTSGETHKIILASTSLKLIQIVVESESGSNRVTESTIIDCI